MDKYGVSWDGQIDINPNGDYYRVQDVAKLTDELEHLRRQLALGSQDIKASPAPEGAKGVFGYASARQAGEYLSGKSKIITLTRRRRHDRAMPVYFNDAPSKFTFGGADLPPLRSMVKTPEGVGRVWSYSKAEPGCIVVKIVLGGRVLVSSWEPVDNHLEAIAQDLNERGLR